MKDKPGDITFFWDDFKKQSPLLKDKSDEEMQEMLYCTLAMCSKVRGTMKLQNKKRMCSTEAKRSKICHMPHAKATELPKYLTPEYFTQGSPLSRRTTGSAVA